MMRPTEEDVEDKKCLVQVVPGGGVQSTLMEDQEDCDKITQL